MFADKHGITYNSKDRLNHEIENAYKEWKRTESEWLT